MATLDSAQKKQMILVGASVVMLLLALWIIWPKSKPLAGSGKRWFYNLTTGKLEAIDTRQFPPVLLPSGDVGVVAWVFANGSCENAADRFIGYLERYNHEPAPLQAPDEADSAASPEEGPGGMGGPGDSLVADPKDTKQWFRSSSGRGRQLINVSTRVPGAGPLVPCRPGSFTPD